MDGTEPNDANHPGGPTVGAESRRQVWFGVAIAVLLVAIVVVVVSVSGIDGSHPAPADHDAVTEHETAGRVVTHFRDARALEFRPVLSVTAAGTSPSCDDSSSKPHELRGQFSPTTSPVVVVQTTTGTPATTSPPPTDPPTTTMVPVPPGDTAMPSQDGKICYVVGPVGFTATDLGRAQATLDTQGQWSIDVNVRKGSREKANRAMDACYQGVPTCPGQNPQASPNSGAIAIVRHGVVISAPTVNAPDLANAQFQISGNFTRTTAVKLVEALGG